MNNQWIPASGIWFLASAFFACVAISADKTDADHLIPDHVKATVYGGDPYPNTVCGINNGCEDDLLCEGASAVSCFRKWDVVAQNENDKACNVPAPGSGITCYESAVDDVCAYEYNCIWDEFEGKCKRDESQIINWYFGPTECSQSNWT